MHIVLNIDTNFITFKLQAVHAVALNNLQFPFPAKFIEITKGWPTTTDNQLISHQLSNLK